MTGCFFIPTAEQLQFAIAAGVPIIHLLARLICVATPTPSPDSRWARAYRLIEVIALEVGHAKDTGLLPKTPAIDRFAGDGVEFLKRAARSEEIK